MSDKELKPFHETIVSRICNEARVYAVTRSTNDLELLCELLKETAVPLKEIPGMLKRLRESGLFRFYLIDEVVKNLKKRLGKEEKTASAKSESVKDPSLDCFEYAKKSE